MIDVPPHWRVAPLADLLVPQPNGRLLQQGWSPQCIPTPSPGHEAWGVLKTTAIQPGRFDDSQNKELPNGLLGREAIEVSPGDLLMTCAGPRARCGVPALVRRTRPRLMMSGKMYRFRPTSDLLAEFLEKWLLSDDAQGSIDAMKTGISDSGLNLTQDRFLSLRVPVPPIDEQRRIVEILDDQLSRLAAAEAYLDRARLRAMSLAKSRLWRATHGDHPTVELSSIADVKLGRQRSPKNHQGAQMVSYLRAANVDWNRLRLEDVKAMHFSDTERETFLLRPDDILMTEASGSPAEVGKSVLYDGHPEGVCFQNTVLRVRSHGALPEYLQKYLLADAMTGQFMAHARGVGIHHLGRARLAGWPIQLPHAERQAAASREAANALDETAVLERQIDVARRRAAGLRRSLLASAFEGRLTGGGRGDEVIEELAAKVPDADAEVCVTPGTSPHPYPRVNL